MGTKKGKIIYLLIMCIVLCLLPTDFANGAKKVKLSKTKITMTVGKTAKLSVKNYGKKVVWKSSSSGKVKVVSSGKTSAKLYAKKSGSVKITAKCGKKTLSCKVIVNKEKKNNSTATPKITKSPTPAPTDYISDAIKYISDQKLSWVESEESYLFQFSIKLSDYKTREVYDGNVEISIVNGVKQTLYSETIYFKKGNFDKYIEDEDGYGYLCSIWILKSNIEKGKVASGEFQYSINLNDGTWFSTRTLPMDSLELDNTPTPKPTPTPTLTPKPTLTVKPTPTLTPKPSRAPMPSIRPVDKTSYRDQNLKINVNQLLKKLKAEGNEQDNCYSYERTTIDGYRYVISYNTEDECLQYYAESGEIKEYISLENAPTESDITSIHYEKNDMSKRQKGEGWGTEQTSMLRGDDMISLNTCGGVEYSTFATDCRSFLMESYVQWNDMLWDLGVTLQDVGFDNWGCVRAENVMTSFSNEDETKVLKIFFSRFQNRLLRGYMQQYTVIRSMTYEEDEYGNMFTFEKTGDYASLALKTYPSDKSNTYANFHWTMEISTTSVIDISWEGYEYSLYLVMNTCTGRERPEIYGKGTAPQLTDAQKTEIYRIIYTGLYGLQKHLQYFGLNLRGLGFENYEVESYDTWKNIRLSPSPSVEPTATVKPTGLPKPSNTPEPTVTPQPVSGSGINGS